MSPYTDVKQRDLVDCEMPPYTGTDSPDCRPDPRISTDIQRFSLCSMKTIDEESACSWFDDLPSLAPAPQLPPLAHIPLSAMTIAGLSRSP